jgi:hypothetical protein
MDAPALVALLQSRGIMLAVSDGNIAVHHHGELTDADRDLIRTHKPAVLAVLAPQSAAVEVPPLAPPDRKPAPAPDAPRYRRACTRCGHARNRTEPYCPRCGNPEFALPGAKPDFALAPGPRGAEPSKLSSPQLAGDYAPREPDARRRYLLRVKNPHWPTDATHDDYRLAARLSILHARGARAYRNEWTDEDQSLADRVRSRRAALS